MRKKSSSLKTDVAKARSQVSAYIAKQPAEARRRLKRIRADIRAVAPRAVDGFSYGVPSARIDGQTLVWYAAFKNHTSLFPMTAAIRSQHATALRGYKTATGTVQFPLDRPLPSGLIKRLVKARAALLRATSKK